MSFNTATFERFAKLISEATGIQWKANRRQALMNRIQARLRHLGIRDYEAYLGLIECNPQGREMEALINSITTNYTQFFRDPRSFEHAKEQLVALMKTVPQRIRVWSAACSSGEEPYSLAITAIEAAQIANVSAENVRILATDIDTYAIRTAVAGKYRQTDLHMLSNDQKKYFIDAGFSRTENTMMVRVGKQVSSMVIFRNLNLCTPVSSVPDNIDLIFCRNVLLYFTTDMQAKILQRCARKLSAHGQLHVGASETVRSMAPGLISVRPSIFRRAPASTVFMSPNPSRSTGKEVDYVHPCY